MTKDEALQMAIKEIEGWIDHAYGHSPEECADNKTIMACKEALEQPAWQGLTDDEIEAIDDVTLGDYYSKKDAMEFARAIEAKLKDKNT
jgi:hypothetical protein